LIGWSGKSPAGAADGRTIANEANRAGASPILDTTNRFITILPANTVM
jgi:hypothetical protein